MNENSLTQKQLANGLLSIRTSASYAQTMVRLVEFNQGGVSLPELAQEVMSGQEVYLTKNGEPVMQLVRLDGRELNPKQEEKMNRPLGAWAHYDSDFDFESWDALDEDVRKLFKNLP